MTRVRTTVWGEADCWTAKEYSTRLLENTGVEVPHPGARELLARAGASVDGTRVRIPPAVVDAAIETAPDGFDVPGRGKDGMRLEQGQTYFGTGPDCMYVHDPETRERRRAVLEDVRTSAALCERLGEVDFVMSMALPEDVDIASDDLEQFAAMLEGTRKPIVMSTSHGSDSLEVMLEMAGLCGERRSFACLIMSSPPLRFDPAAAEKLIGCARLNIPAILAPAPCAGTTAPASMSSAVIIGDAEVLAGLCIHQLACPGAPFVYGVGASALDMRTTLDPYVGPDHFLGNQAGCDLARYHGLPSWSYAGTSDAKTLDEQWSADVAITTLLGGLSRGTLLHDLGYMESGLAGSLDSIVLSDELVGFVRRFMGDLSLDPEAVQFDEIVAAGPGGNHLASPHTRTHYRDFWLPTLFDHTAFERWSADGGRTLRERVSEKTKRLLAEPKHEVPATAHSELRSLIEEARRMREGVATDLASELNPRV